MIASYLHIKSLLVTNWAWMRISHVMSYVRRVWERQHTQVGTHMSEMVIPLLWLCCEDWLQVCSFMMFSECTIIWYWVMICCSANTCIVLMYSFACTLSSSQCAAHIMYLHTYSTRIPVCTYFMCKGCGHLFSLVDAWHIISNEGWLGCPLYVAELFAFHLQRMVRAGSRQQVRTHTDFWLINLCMHSHEWIWVPLYEHTCNIIFISVC